MPRNDDPTRLQISILFGIAGLDDPSGADIADHLEGRHQNRRDAYYRNLDKLVDRGMVNKNRPDASKRENVYTLTDEGEEMVIEDMEWRQEQVLSYFD
ncbi:MarR family winged helix-turn-helix transcriptional regulator [Halococcus saccharolyticus]|uniref:Transcriptional regulator PadR family protein n=1 Tax=Halococcus saccharolyticus DSM 5350 TaxID=1227455 RepID=M0MQQ6_9EURY|nr:MarR family winged helix-turn-helix transcriptional regulator [Halococcus saccharolyticus]EMA47961.1 transcriptional regulator PadR family protein [Halococcus saccharolyticus DSM 5350]